MGIVFRQSIKTSIVTFAGAILGALVLYLSTHLIPEQKFSFRNIFTTQAVLAAQFLLLGMHNTLAVYVHRYHERSSHQAALVTVSFLLPTLLVGVLTIFYLLLQEPVVQLFQPKDIPIVQRYYFLLPFFVLAFTYQVLLEQYLIAQMKMAKAIFQREIVLKILSIATIVLYGYGYINFDLLVYSMILIYVMPILVMFWIAKKSVGFRFTWRWNIFSNKEKKELVHFAWYHSLLNVSANLIGYLDALMLPVLYAGGLESAAAYIPAVFIISFLQIPYRAMVVSTSPIMIQAFRDKDHEKIKDVFTRSSLNILVASVVMFLLIACNLRNAVAILPKGYEMIAPLTLILSVGRMFDMLTGMNDHLISFSKHYKYNFYISLILVILLVGFNYWLIPIYGAVGAAWATSIALILYNFLKLYFVKIKLDLFPFSKSTIVVLGIGAFSFILCYFYPMVFNPYVDTILRSLLIIIVYGSLLVLFRPSPDLNTYITSIRKNKRLF